jgi:arsenate reductase
MEEEAKPLILILCTGNSCRSHMAEGVLREVAGDVLNVQSAGSAPTGSVHPLAIFTLAEIGIDISSHTSKHMNEFLSGNVETVITVCDNADQACPSFPGQSYRHHWPFPDPAKAKGTETEIRNAFKQVRDDIRRVFTDYGLSRINGIQGLPP